MDVRYELPQPAEGKTTEWILRAYQRGTLAADALIASTSLAGTNSHRSSR
jgi:putative transposase